MKKIYPLLVLACLYLVSGNALAQTSTYNFTGGVQTYTVSSGCTLVSVDAIGGCGGGGYVSSGSPGPVNKGGRVQCTLAVSGGEVLYLYVGGAGGTQGTSVIGGYNGGGSGGSNYCAGGGGASDVRVSNTAVGTYTSTNRVVVAGGGGGGGDYSAIGALGGGTTGGSGGVYSFYQAFGGTPTAGGTNSSGVTSIYGIVGVGGNGSGSSGGGGGGLYGGSGGYSNGGGGGGSSYTDPTVCSGVIHTQGYSGATGNGKIIIASGCPGVVASPSSLAFGAVAIGATSTMQAFALTGFNLTGAITLTPPSNYQISSDGGATFSSSPVTYSSFSGGTFSGVVFYVELLPTAAASYCGNIAVTGGGLSSTYNIAVCGSGAAACTGTPTAGSATINGGSTASGSASTIFTLNVPTATVAGGITYQWQVSTVSATSGFSNIPGGNTASYAYSGLAANSWFQCVVACGTSTATSGTAAATFAMPGSSCIPSAASSNSNYPASSPTYPFLLNGINGTSISDASSFGSGTGGSSYYYNSVSLYSVTMSPGGGYSATIGGTLDYYSSAQIWIDFNDNGIFETSEVVGGFWTGTACCASGSRLSAPIAIPLGATVGAHRMRVMAAYTAGVGAGNPNYPSYPNQNPCPNSSIPVYYADTRDYTAVIANPSPAVVPTPSSIAFGAVTVGTSSAPAGYFALNGSNLVPAVGFFTASAPANFLLSLNGTSWTSSVNVPYTGGTITAANVYVQFNPTAVTSYSGNVTVSGGGIPSVVTIPVSGSGQNICTGTPTAGAAAITPASGGVANLFTLSLGGSSSVGGLTYQWQSAASSSGPFTSIPGAVSPTYSFVGISSNKFFQCIVTCVASGLSATSSPVSATFIASTPASTSCTAVTDQNGSCCNFWIGMPGHPFFCPGDAGTSITDATQTSGILYYDQTATYKVNMSLGGAYTTNVGNATNPQSIQIWIDFNGDGSFSTAESVGGVGYYSSGVAHPVITIPSTGVSPGAYRMRVVLVYNCCSYGPGASVNYPDYPSIPSCPLNPISYDEARDYTVIIGPAPVAPCNTPNAGIVSPSQASSCNTFTPNLYGVGETIAATGITYQWQSGSSATGPFTNIFGATGESFVPSPISTVGTTYYRNNVTCTVSGVTASSSAQAITLNPQPSPITGPNNVCTGLTINLASSPTGGTWTSSNNSNATVVAGTGVVTGVAGVAVPNISYTLPTGCFSVAPITVNVNPSAISGTTPICGSLNSTFTDAVSGGTWSSSSNSIASVGSLTGLVTGGSAGAASISYTSSSGCSTIFPVTINPLSAITGLSSLCAGLTTSFSDATSGGTWSSANTTVATINSSGLASAIAIGSTTISYTIASTGCTATKVFNVTNIPSVYTMSGGGSYCSGGSGGSGVIGAHVILNGSDPGITYQLYNGATPVGASVTGSGFFIDFGLEPVGCYGVIANPGTGCATTMAGTTCVTVNALPTAYTVSGGGNYCVGGTGVHVFLNNSTIGINYQVYCTTSSGTIPIGTTVAGTSAPLDFGLQTILGTYTVVATNPVTGCIGNMSGSVTVGNNPLPVAQTVSSSGSGYCIGGTGISVGLLGSVSGTSYQLTLGGFPVGAPVIGTGTAISFGPQTTGGTYVVIATNPATSCTATMSGTPTITVNPLPTAFTVTGGGNYCAGSTVGVPIGLNGSTINVNYQLYYTAAGGSPVTVGTLIPGTGAAISFGPSFTAIGSYSVVAINPLTTCTNNMTGSVAIATNALPSVLSVTPGTASSYCSGGTGIAVGLSGSVAGTTYQLFLNGGLVGALSGTGSALNFGSQTNAGTYTVTGSITYTAGTCSANMSGSTVVSVNPLPIAQTITIGTPAGSIANICAGATVGQPVSLSGSQTGVSYQLFNGSAPSGSLVAGTGSTLTLGTVTAGGSYSAVGTSTAGCVNNMTGSAVLNVNSLPTVYSVTGGGGYCAGGTGTHIGLSASNTGVSYSLLRAGGTISSLPGAGAALDFGTQTVAGTYTISATNPSTTCSVNMSGSAVVSINPLPAATYSVTVTGGGNYCAGGPGQAIGLNPSDAGVNYQLLNGGVPTGAPVAGIASAPITFGLKTATGTYTVLAMNGTTGCTSTETGSATITVNSLPSVFTVSGGGTAYCSGGAGIPVTLSASTSGISYTLMNGAATVPPAIIGSGAAINFPPQTASGTYSVVATNPATNCSSTMSGTAVINILGLPTAYTVTQPLGSSYCQGGTGVPIGLSSSSIGTNYQLMSGSTSVGAPVAGTGVAISFGLQTGAGAYTVVATNTSTGCSTTMTGIATVVINASPAPQVISGGGNYCPGGTGSVIGLLGSVSGTSYQLFVGSTPVGALVPGTGAPVTFGSATTTGVYTVAATNTAGCTSNMPGSVNVGLYTLPVAFNVTGGGNFCPAGTGVPVGLSGSTLGINYQLYSSGGGGPVGPLVPGTGFSISFGPQTTAGTYTVVAINNTSSCTNNMSGSATVILSPLPAAHTVTGGGNYCMAGGGLHIGIDGSDIGNHYQLYLGSVPVGSYMTGTGLAIDFGAQTAAGTYKVLATSTATTCSNWMTGSEVINVVPLPAVQTVTGGGNFCAGGAGIDVGLSSSVAGVNYQLYNGLSTVGIPIAGSGGALDFGMQTTGGSYTIVATDMSTSCTNMMSGSANVVANVLPTAYTVLGGGNYCSGGTGTHVMLSGSNLGIAYQLIVDGSALGVPVPGTGAALDFGPQTTAGSYTVMAANTSTTCTNTMSGSVTITINALPNSYTVIGAGTNYCAGGAGIDVTLSGSDAGINYQLYKGTAATGTPVAGTGFSIDLGSQTAAGSYTVVAINPATTCSSNMTGAATVVVNPLPTAFTVVGGGNYCNGGTGVHISLSGSNVGVSYQLWNGAISTGAPMSGTGFALDFGLQTASGTYTVVATNLATGCTNTMSGSGTVIVNPLPTSNTVTGGGNYCAGTAGTHIGLGGSTSGVNYQLYNGITPVGTAMAGSGLALDFGAQTITGTYTVMAINGSTSCTSNMAGTATVGINAAPTAYAVTGGGNYCPGGEGVNVGLSSSNSGISYQLMNGTAPVGTAWPGTGTAINFGTIFTAGNYTVVATNNTTTCSSNMSGTATVGLNPQPTVYSVIGGGNYCAGGAGVHVGVNSSNSGINYQLVLSGTATGSPVSGTSGPLDFGLQTTPGSYTVLATNAGTGCNSTMSGTAVVAATLPVSPAVALSTGVGDTVCSGHLVTLNALVTNGGSAPTYQWSVNGTPQSAIGGSFSYLPADGDVVTATVTSSAACATPSMVNTSLALSVLENGMPSVTVTATPGISVCKGSTVDYSTSTAFGGTPTLTWIVNGTNVSTSGTYSYVPSNNDVVYVVMSSNYRCRSANTVPSNHITMSVADSVVPTVSITASPSSHIANGQQLTMTATVVNGGSTPSYQWFVNGFPVPGATLPSYTSNTFQDGDSVTCQVVSSGACNGLTGFNSVTIHVSNVGVKTVTAASGEIQVVPNPSKGFFIVKGTLGTTTDEEVTMEITDMLGQVIYNSKVMTHGGNINERVQLNNTIANGMYILSLHSDSDNKVFHIVVEQ